MRHDDLMRQVAGFLVNKTECLASIKSFGSIFLYMPFISWTLSHGMGHTGYLFNLINKHLLIAGTDTCVQVEVDLFQRGAGVTVRVMALMICGLLGWLES